MSRPADLENYSALAFSALIRIARRANFRLRNPSDRCGQRMAGLRP